MEKAIVTFKNVNSDNEIQINLTYDKKVGNLDYDVKFNNCDENSNLDFVGILADIFIKSLREK